jgi:thioredoxin-related protein
MRTLFFLLILLPLFWAKAAMPPKIDATELFKSTPVTLNTKNADKKGLVVIFMSAKCPCSDSHVSVVKNLLKKYANTFSFYIIHSNLEETLKETQSYFKKAAFDAPVIQDQETKLADLFKAYKTPHSFIVNPQGEVVYQGGVTNSSNAPSADRNYLEEALSEIEQGKAVTTAEGRTLGCVIMRRSELPK